MKVLIATVIGVQSASDVSCVRCLVVQLFYVASVISTKASYRQLHGGVCIVFFTREHAGHILQLFDGRQQVLSCPKLLSLRYMCSIYKNRQSTKKKNNKIKNEISCWLEIFTKGFMTEICTKCTSTASQVFFLS